MSNLNKKPERYVGGLRRPRRASELNATLDALHEQLMGSGGINVAKYGDKVVINAIESDDTTGVLGVADRYFVVISELEDVLQVAPYFFPIINNGQVYDPLLFQNCTLNQADHRIYIAKPILLQETMWNGALVSLRGVPTVYTYTGLGTRIATNPDGSVDQAITPAYFPGEIIVARECPTQLSYNVTIDAEEIEVQILHIDANESARRWENVGAEEISTISCCKLYYRRTNGTFWVEETDTDDYHGVDPGNLSWAGHNVIRITEEGFYTIGFNLQALITGSAIGAALVCNAAAYAVIYPLGPTGTKILAQEAGLNGINVSTFGYYLAGDFFTIQNINVVLSGGLGGPDSLNDVSTFWIYKH